MKLSILDFGEIAEGSNAISRIDETIQMAQRAEDLRYTRYWLGEHYEDNAAWRNPLLIISIVASFTESIKVGAAGILLPISNPLRVAQESKLLANLFSGRIDLGIAKGSVPAVVVHELGLSTEEIQTNLSNHYQRADKILDLLNDNQPGIITPPKNGEVPEVWFLATSGGNNAYVTDKKLNLSLSLFHTSRYAKTSPDPSIIKDLKARFEVKHGYSPSFNIAISAVCCKTDKQAQEIKASYRSDFIKINCIGTKNKVFDELSKLKEDYETEEIVILDDPCPSFRDKIYSYETMAEFIKN